MRARPAFSRLSVALLATAQVLAACQRPPPAPPAEPPPAAAPAVAPAPLVPAVMDRAELLRALDRAASAYAAGRPDGAADLSDRRFVVRQVFGCGGPAAAATPGLARWTWTRDRKAIEISLAPADWAAHDGFTGKSEGCEAVEGFWIARPWLREEGCPPTTVTDAPAVAAAAPNAGDAKAPAHAPPADPPAPTADRQVAGLAAVFAQGGSRLGRRDGKPFAFTRRAEGDTPLKPPTGGYRLVIEGRLSAFSDGGAIRCHAPSPDVRPVCIAAAEVDRVAFEEADGKLLREWRPG